MRDVLHFDNGSARGRRSTHSSVFAEFEHATIVDRISAGIERRAKQGLWKGGRPPFGYIHLREERTLVPDPVRAPVVRRIFELYARDRLGTASIAERLRAERLPGPAAGWSHRAVHWILTNPTYLGQIRWRDQAFPATHEPLVDPELYAHAQALLQERGRDVSRRRGNASAFLLSDVLRCGQCGRAYIGMSATGNGGRYHYYACTGGQKYGPKACQGERLPRHKLEDAVVAQLVELYRDGGLVRAALAKASERAKHERPRLAEQLAAVRAELAAAERARERYFAAFEAGTLSPALCEKRLASLATRLDELRAREAELALSHDQEGELGLRDAELAAVAAGLQQVSPTASPRR